MHTPSNSDLHDVKEGVMEPKLKLIAGGKA